MSQTPDLIDFNTAELRALARVAFILSQRDGDRHTELLTLAKTLTDEELVAIVGIANTVAPFGTARRDLLFAYLESGGPLIGAATVEASQRRVM